jgi:hypothetical protein
MTDFKELAGSYVGRCRIREGMESALSPAEKGRFMKNTEKIPLTLKPDGAFHYKGTTEGSCQIEGDLLKFVPTVFNGSTKEAMEKAAFEAERVFGLAWLFNPFELKVEGATLVSPDEKSVIYTEFVRADP